MALRTGIVVAVLAAAAGAAQARLEWVDPDTPDVQRTKRIGGVEHVLVFSDEFNVDGRTFKDGHDPKWTGLNGPVYTNEQYNAYNDSLAYTKGGNLILETTNEDWVHPELGLRHYQTAMLQTWDKFCFQEGYVEIKARMPGRHDVGGLWPAFWLMGNLGRATFTYSTDGIWPFNYDYCPPDDERDANQWGTQRITACGKEGEGRGAPEIDIIEVQPGDFVYDYQYKIDQGICPPVPESVLRNIATRQPFVSTSLQAAPGLPVDALERPTQGCLPTNFTAPDGTVREQYYPELYPSSENYGTVYGDGLQVAINYEFFGDEFTIDGQPLHTDAMSANTMLGKTHWDDFHQYQAHFKSGADGFMKFSLDGTTQLDLPASVVEAPRPVTFSEASGKQSGTLRGRRVPVEPMYLILNVDLSPRWGWNFCPSDRCDCCADCKQSRCTTCIEVDAQGNSYNSRQWLAELCDSLPAQYEIDYVRVYQPEDKVKVGCDPDDHPTREIIAKDLNAYTPFRMDEPLVAVLPGGANCTLADELPCGDHGECVRAEDADGDQAWGTCACAKNWTGPRCLAPAAGAALACQDLDNAGASSVGVSLTFLRQYGLDVFGLDRDPGACRSLEAYNYTQLVTLAERQCALAEGTEAEAACKDISPRGKYWHCSPRQRANHVLQAWSLKVTNGVECCNLLAETPYCQRREFPWLVTVVIAGVLWACCVMPLLRPTVRAKLWAAWNDLPSMVGACACCARCMYRCRNGKDAAAAAAAGGAAGAVAVAGSKGGDRRGGGTKAVAVVGAGADGDALVSAAAESALVGTSAPRADVRPEAMQQLAHLFHDLERLYGFQPDSVRNQLAHLGNLWRAQTGTCGDERLAAQQLHDIMFDSFERWLDTSAGLNSFDRRRHVVRNPYRTPSHRRRLREMALYLCLWGEAGNLRFCPEALCFFFECARHHRLDSAQQQDSERSRLRFGSGGPSAADPGAYMRAYVRPLYDCMFESNFSGLDARGRPVAKPIQPGASRVNYDDWNEMFWTRERIRSIVTKDGVPVVDYPVADRWAQLARCDWPRSLRDAKRHHEVHTWHNLFASYARVANYHVASFYLLMLLSLVVFARGTWAEPENSLFLYAGFLVPGLVQFAADLSKVRLKPHATIAGTLFEADKSLPYLLQILLFIVFIFVPAEFGREASLIFSLFSTFVIIRTAIVPRGLQRKVQQIDSNVYQPPGTVPGLVAFWIVCLVGKAAAEFFVLLRAVAIATVRIEELRPLKPLIDLGLYWQVLVSRELLARNVQQAMVWVAAFLVHCSSTYFWYTLTVCVAGFLRGLYMFRLAGRSGTGPVQRVHSPADVPAAFVTQVFAADDPDDRGDGGGGASFRRLAVVSPMHPLLERKWARVWNDICRSMCEADIVSPRELAMLLYGGADGGPHDKLRRPAIFEAGSRRSEAVPQSREFRRRFSFLALTLSMRMPRPFPVEGTPSFSVLIPHYAETIITSEAELFADAPASTAKGGETSDRPQPLISLLMEYFPQELANFRARIGETQWTAIMDIVAERLSARGLDAAAAAARARRAQNVPPPPSPAAAERRFSTLLPLRLWASLRTQTLYRTVRGMMYYERAMRLLLSVQRPDLSPEDRERIVADKFSCVVSMQRYAQFSPEELSATEVLLSEFPNLQIAFIDEEGGAPDGEGATHAPGRRYLSCLVDGSCPVDPATNRRVARLRVELPGFPILGDGKGDNQNHALVFTRGRLVQTIDANQEGYLEEALKVCNAMAEFESARSGTRDRISILGFREHIFSGLGTLADFAASSEFVFGTLMQRTMDRPLLSRQYYGHPDVMEKFTMVSQGGVSKATKGLNLSEDVFAGMDLTLRGGNVVHREYMQVGKGRDMGFLSILAFFSKLSRGCAEMSLTRQSYRLGTRLTFPRLLGFFYAHVGYYFTPVLMEMAIWSLVFVLLYFVLCDVELTAPDADEDLTYASIASELLDAQFGPICLLFVLAQALPLFTEVMLELGIVKALTQLISQLLTLSFVFFSFQARLIGHYFAREISEGGAGYIATGRGIATLRQPFHSLFNAFARPDMYPGLELGLMLALAVAAAPARLPDAPFWIAAGVVVFSWIYAPFVFNPGQFRIGDVLASDLWGWCRWVVRAGPQGWRAWQGEDLERRRKVPLALFAVPGRHVLAAVVILGLIKDTLREKVPAIEGLRLDTVEVVVFLLPVGALAATLVLLPFAQLLPGVRRVPYVPIAYATAVLHLAEGYAFYTYGGVLNVARGRLDPLRLNQVVLLCALKYMSLQPALAVCAWLLPAEDETPQKGGCSPVRRAISSVFRNMLLGYRLVADALSMLLVVVPSFALACVPGITLLHTLLLYRVRPSRTVSTAQLNRRTDKQRDPAATKGAATLHVRAG